jgi:hypothetical protein
MGINISNPISDSSRKMKYVASVKSVTMGGTSDYLDCGDATDFSHTSGYGASNDLPFSVSAWVKASGTQNYTIVSKADAASGNHEYRVFMLGNKIYFDVYSNTNNVYKRAYSVNAHTYANTWVHYVATYAGDFNVSNPLRIYINGVLDITGTGSGGTYTGMNNETSKLTFGHMLSDPNYDLAGNMSDIMMWKDYELSPAEVDAMYNDGVYSVDPMEDKGSYGGAAYCKLWLKCDADVAITSPTSSTVYVSYRDPATPEVPPSGSILKLTSGEEFDEHCSGFTDPCWKIIDPAGTPGITGTPDYSGGTVHNTSYVNQTSLNASTTPCSAVISNEYAF